MGRHPDYNHFFPQPMAPTMRDRQLWQRVPRWASNRMQVHFVAINRGEASSLPLSRPLQTCKQKLCRKHPSRAPHHYQCTCA